jgi:hypothetical protein
MRLQHSPHKIHRLSILKCGVNRKIRNNRKYSSVIMYSNGRIKERTEIIYVTAGS